MQVGPEFKQTPTGTPPKAGFFFAHQEAPIIEFIYKSARSVVKIMNFIDFTLKQ
jgi:hypothetical protein